MNQSTPGRRVTLQDIADRTGYSVNTVSHALRNMPDISPKTREKIRQTAKQMGYLHNQLASSLRSGRTRTIAVILGSMSNPYYGIFADTLQVAAAAKGYSLLFMCSRENSDLELSLAETAVARRADGIILLPTNSSERTIRRLQLLNMPLVLLSRTLLPGEVDSVVCDEEKGAYLATTHLIENGARKPAYLATYHIVYSYEKRLKGFKRACDEAGIPESEQRVCILSEGDGDVPTADKLKTTLLQWKQEGVDAIFVFCDVEAWAVQATLKHTPGLAPSDFGIAGFDNIKEVQQYPTSLCSVGASFRDMADRAIDRLRDRIHGNAEPPRTLVCEVHLHCDGSCRREANALN